MEEPGGLLVPTPKEDKCFLTFMGSHNPPAPAPELYVSPTLDFMVYIVLSVPL